MAREIVLTQPINPSKSNVNDHLWLYKLSNIFFINSNYVLISAKQIEDYIAGHI